MSKNYLSLLLLSSIIVLSLPAAAQSSCPPGVASDKLICLLPQVYGVNGLVLTNSGTQFQTSFLSSTLKPLNSALARQSALFPMASPSAGVIQSWDLKTGEISTVPDNLGPLFGERAETIGKHHVAVVVGYQRFKLGTLDGVNLKNLPVVFTQPDVTVDFGAPIGVQTCSVTGTNDHACAVIRDVIRTTNRIDLAIDQTTTSITFGVTNQIDVSALIPIDDIRMSIVSNASIINNSNTQAHSFKVTTACPFQCLSQTFSNSRTASGIGDIILRVKGTAWKGARAALALGADVRMPTGDSLNFIGAGAAGVRPFVAWSYRSRIAPHVLVGYETNGSSLIAGDITTGTKERLPSQLTYSVGADVWLTRWVTTAFDLVGQQVFQSLRTSVVSSTELGKCKEVFPNCATFSPAATDSTLAQSTGSFNVTNMAVGVKVRPFGSKQAISESRPFSNFVFMGNVLLKMNEGGLRAQAVPLLGVSYTF